MNDERPKRGINWTLMSVLLNVFLAGGIASSAWYLWSSSQHAQHHDRPAAQATAGGTGPVKPRSLPAAADNLSPAQRQAFRSGLHEVLRDNAGLTRSSHEGRLEAARLLAAPVLDRAAIDGALARTRAADIEQRERIEAYVMAYAATLPPADRESFAQALPGLQGPFHVTAPRAKP
ncbi:periplasmic heavy metal sensor [Variovorax sp. PAMC26660]|uniref:periplasmic heavy metal sensor n=1 Tax=Variovorax sp. PAMC26660 TaxID=2762322 RepID=UPI00164E05D5|nr:periplasmic heavy metal sensor [Variovorax sp. PAMC26660]QNK70452.1 periplasmic heavy metal sensor [Variovorax sp. PAMC26660]